MSKCKQCPDGEMVLKKDILPLYCNLSSSICPPLVVQLPYHECNSCGFDIVSYELMVVRNAIVKEAKPKLCASVNRRK